jgi:hypothetical protein
MFKYDKSGVLTAYTAFGLNATCSGISVMTDSSSNVYFTGFYASGSAPTIFKFILNPSLVSTTYTFPASVAIYSSFLIKYSPSGELLGFTSLVGKSGIYPTQGSGMALDPSGNLYLTGYYNTNVTVNINKIALVSALSSSGYTLPSLGTSTAGGYIFKYSQSGELLSFTGLVSSDTIGVKILSITVDSSGNLYVVGYYSSTTAPLAINNLALNSSLSPSGYTLPTSTSSTDFFILKYNSSGVIVGFMTVPNTGAANTSASIISDSSGNIYFTGSYNSTSIVNINNIALSTVYSGYYFPISTAVDIFVLKYNSSGTMTAYTLTSGTGGDSGIGISVSSSTGDVAVTGFYNSTTAVPLFNLSVIPSAAITYLPATTTNDFFLIKYNSNGDVTACTVLSGNTGSDQGSSVAFDYSSNLTATGYYTSSTVVAVKKLGLDYPPLDSTYTIPISTANGGFTLKYSG